MKDEKKVEEEVQRGGFLTVMEGEGRETGRKNQFFGNQDVSILIGQHFRDPAGLAVLIGLPACLPQFLGQEKG